MEAGVSAEFVLRKDTRYPVVVSVPMSMGLGDELYYFGPHFGCVSTGVNVRTPLSFVPRQYGRWTASTSADMCYFGTTVAEFVRSVSVPIPRISASLSIEL